MRVPEEGSHWRRPHRSFWSKPVASPWQTRKKKKTAELPKRRTSPAAASSVSADKTAVPKARTALAGSWRRTAALQCSVAGCFLGSGALLRRASNLQAPPIQSFGMPISQGNLGNQAPVLGKWKTTTAMERSCGPSCGSRSRISWATASKKEVPTTWMPSVSFKDPMGVSLKSLLKRLSLGFLWRPLGSFFGFLLPFGPALISTGSL